MNDHRSRYIAAIGLLSAAGFLLGNDGCNPCPEEFQDATRDANLALREIDRLAQIDGPPTIVFEDLIGGSETSTLTYAGGVASVPARHGGDWSATTEFAFLDGLTMRTIVPVTADADFTGVTEVAPTQSPGSTRTGSTTPTRRARGLPRRHRPSSSRSSTRSRRRATPPSRSACAKS